MGKKYNKCTPTGANTVSVDVQCAFEVASGRIITYDVEKKGFLGHKIAYNEVDSLPITRETTVNIFDHFGTAGMCQIGNTSNKRDCYDYPVIDVDEFAAKVRAEIARAPS